MLVCRARGATRSNGIAKVWLRTYPRPRFHRVALPSMQGRRESKWEALLSGMWSEGSRDNRIVVCRGLSVQAKAALQSLYFLI